jgi:hypothetical protein
MVTKKTKLNEDTVIRNMLNCIRNKEQKTLLKEDANSGNPIAITNDPKFGQDVLKNQIEEFRAAVDGGAQFASENSSSPTASPLVYIPSTNQNESGNLIFSGTIPSLNKLKWQFILKDENGDGLLLWADGLRLSKENLQILNKLQGHYKNWKAQWQQSESMLVNLGKSNE